MTGCPEPEALARLAEGEAGAEGQPLRGHLEECAECRRLVAALLQQGAAPAGPPHEVLAPGTVLGRYVVEHLAGAGGMGVVYAAQDPELGRRVALKLVRPSSAVADAEARLRREAQAMARIRHPAVVSVFDVGRFQDQLFLALEWVEGEPLRGWMSKARPYREVVRLFVSAARGLAAAHAAGVVHRDVKPENLIVEPSGRPRLLDFGLASSADGPLGARATLGGGTEGYVAPERLAGAPNTPASDQYSLCVTLCEALTGRRPVDGAADAALQSVKPAWLRGLVKRGLARDPKQRFPSLEQLAEALTRGLARRRRLQMSAGLLLGAALLAGAGWRAPQPSCTEPPPLLASVWTTSSAQRLRQALGGRDSAGELAARIEESFGRFTGAAKDAYLQACRAGRGGLQTPHQLSSRLRCLDEQLKRASARGRLIERLAGDPSVDLFEALPAAEALALCSEEQPPYADEPLESGEARPRLEALRATLAELAALAELGQLGEALPRAEAAVGEARALGHRRLQAEALLVLADVQYRLRGRQPIDEGTQRADATLEEALVAAEETGDRQALLAGYIQGVGHRLIDSRLSEARRYGLHVESLLRRVAAPASLRASWLHHQARLAESERKLDEAERHLTEAAQLLAPEDGAPVPPQWVKVQNLAGIVASQRGEPRRAVERFEQAIARVEKDLGPSAHARSSLFLNLAEVELELGELEASERHLAAAHREFLRMYGAGHPAMGLTQMTRADHLVERDQPGQALQLLGQVVESLRAAGATRHFVYLYARCGQGRALLAQKKHREVEATLSEVLEDTARFGPMFSLTSERCRLVRAQAAQAAGQWRLAEREWTRLLHGLEGFSWPTPLRPAALTGLAEVALAEGRQEAARELLEEALAQRAALEWAPQIEGQARFAMARALAERGDRAAAREWLTAARADLVRAGRRGQTQRAALEVWARGR